MSQVVRIFRSAVKGRPTSVRWASKLHERWRLYERADKETDVADEPRREDPETPAEPAQVDDTEARAKAHNESTETVEPEVIDDDRFQATDN
jgi:hypothetical protein